MAGVPTIGKTGSPLLARIRNAITSDACQLMSPKTALRGRHSHSIFVGQFRTSARVIAMSALLPTTDVNDRRINVLSCQERT